MYRNHNRKINFAGDTMAKTIKIISVISVALTFICGTLYYFTALGFLLTIAIIFGTTAYHLLMRLAVGWIINLFLKNCVNYHKKWFNVSERELKLYKKLKVRKWKNNMPTYDSSFFDSKAHSWEEIAQAMCQAEIVHEVIVVLSFLPILAYIPFGALGVFIITSLLSACFDMMFVIMQRYNRPRIIKLINKRRSDT